MKLRLNIAELFSQWSFLSKKQSTPIYLQPAWPFLLGLFAIVPLACVYLFLVSNMGAIAQVEKEISALEVRSKLSKKAYQRRVDFKNHYAGSDKEYVPNHLEKLHFLSIERALLHQIKEHPAFRDFAPLQIGTKGFFQLNKQLGFTRESSRSKFGFTESIYRQEKPVFGSFSDLAYLLSWTEGVIVDSAWPNACRPQLVVTEFHLDKQKILGEKEVFSLSCNLLHRDVDICTD
ncbi:MAG: hypothetical protein S4CHLAM102_06610 [Chlamydiia bacterium]|nr:hypothetical protein [Chlamydiia bacterium]